MKGNQIQKKNVLVRSALAFVLALALGLALNVFSITSYAATGTITARSVNIRKEPSTSSEVVGSTESGKTVTVNGKTTGGDNRVWYQVVVDASTVGYIREDLITVTEDVPDVGGGTQAPAPNEGTVAFNPTVAVTSVQPVAATLTGSEAVRVRGDADPNQENIIVQLPSETTVTVTGYATGTDANVWYLVTFDNNGTEAQGFVLSEYVVLGGDLVPADTSTPDDAQPDTDQAPGDTTEDPSGNTNPGNGEFELSYEANENGENIWYLYDYVNKQKYDARAMVNLVLDKYPKTIRNQKIAIVILVFLFIGAGAAAGYLYMKLREASNAAYFSAVEKETIRQRNAAKAKSGKDAPAAKRVAPKVGPEGQKTASGTQAKPGQPKQGSAQPARQTAQGAQARPSSGQARPAQPGTRPAGSAGTPSRQPGQASGQARPAQPGVRPAGSAGTQARPSGQARPAQSGTRPAGSAGTPSRQPGQASRPAQSQADARPSGTRPQPKPAQEAGTQSNRASSSVNDDDDFNFEFLNWDGDDK